MRFFTAYVYGATRHATHPGTPALRPRNRMLLSRISARRRPRHTEGRPRTPSRPASTRGGGTDTQADALSDVVRGITRFSPNGCARLPSTEFADYATSRVPDSLRATCVHYGMSIPAHGRRPPRNDRLSGRRRVGTASACGLHPVMVREGQQPPARSRNCVERGTNDVPATPAVCAPPPTPEAINGRSTRLRHPTFDVSPSPRWSMG